MLFRSIIRRENFSSPTPPESALDSAGTVILLCTGFLASSFLSKCGDLFGRIFRMPHRAVALGIFSHLAGGAARPGHSFLDNAANLLVSGSEAKELLGSIYSPLARCSSSKSASAVKVDAESRIGRAWRLLPAFAIIFRHTRRTIGSFEKNNRSSGAAKYLPYGALDRKSTRLNSSH